MRCRVWIAVLSSVALASGVLAHSGATGIVKERMDGMTALAASMKTLVGMQKSGHLDRDKVREAAQVLQTHSGAAMTARFPPGAVPMVSEASPAIWTQWERFSEIAQDLQETAKRMEAATASETFDLDAFIAPLGETCTACHKAFRIKK